MVVARLEHNCIPGTEEVNDGFTHRKAPWLGNFFKSPKNFFGKSVSLYWHWPDKDGLPSSISINFFYIQLRSDSYHSFVQDGIFLFL